MAFRILNQTETKATIKVWGTDTSGNISLAGDLLSPTMIVNGTPAVNITFLQWSSSSKSDSVSTDVININRGGETVIGLYQNTGVMDFGGNGGMTEDTNNTSDIEYQIIGNGYAYITVRKVAGYASKIETAQYSVYDNTTVVGS